MECRWFKISAVGLWICDCMSQIVKHKKRKQMRINLIENVCVFVEYMCLSSSFSFVVRFYCLPLLLAWLLHNDPRDQNWVLVPHRLWKWCLRVIVEKKKYNMTPNSYWHSADHKLVLPLAYWYFLITRSIE